MVKSVAIIIRSHGSIRTYFDNTSKSLEQIISIQKAPLSTFNLVSLSNLGGVCYGDSLDEYISFIRKLSKNNKKGFNTMSIDDKINYLYDLDSGRKLSSSEDKIFVDNKPTITNVTDGYVDKIYSNDTEKLDFGSKFSIELLFSEGYSDEEIAEFRQELKKITDALKSSDTNKYLSRSQIVNLALNFNTDNLYLIDLTCDAYKQHNNSEISGEQASWITNELNKLKLRGGKLNKHKKTKKSKKTNKSKKSNKTKKSKKYKKSKKSKK